MTFHDFSISRDDAAARVVEHHLGLAGGHALRQPDPRGFLLPAGDPRVPRAWFSPRRYLATTLTCRRAFPRFVLHKYSKGKAACDF